MYPNRNCVFKKYTTIKKKLNNNKESVYLLSPYHSYQVDLANLIPTTSPVSPFIKVCCFHSLTSRLMQFACVFGNLLTLLELPQTAANILTWNLNILPINLKPWTLVLHSTNTLNRKVKANHRFNVPFVFAKGQKLK